MNDQPIISERGEEDFRMSYRIMMDEIRFIKSQQWRVTTYVLLLLAGLAVFYRFVDLSYGTVTRLEVWALIILVFLLGGVGCLLLYDFQKKILNHRLRIRDMILPSMSKEFQKIDSDNNTQQSKQIYSITYESMLALVLAITMLVGSSFVAWFFLKQTLEVAKGG